jgi:hypothetical protein
MPACLEWAEELSKECTEWRDDGSYECSEWRDDGYSECSDWDEDCCDWWPCSWGCKIVSWICVASVWVSSWVCVGFVWISSFVCIVYIMITTLVCVVWDLVTTIVNAVLVTLESILGWVLSGLAAIIAILLSLPIIGAIIRWLLNFLTAIIWFLIGLPDLILGLLGIRPEKLLRVCPVILTDERGKPVGNLKHAIDQLQIAANLMKRECNVRLVPLKPFQYATGLNGAPTVTADWIKVIDRGSHDSDVLDPDCDLSGFGADLGVAGSKFNLLMMVHCFYGAWRRLLGYGAPVSVFFVRSQQGGAAEGCGMWIVDFITVVGHVMPVSEDFRRVTVHEMGHATNLLHVDGTGDNVMIMPRPSTTNVMDFIFYTWQILLIRASKHVSYF